MKKKILCVAFMLSAICVNAYAAADVSMVDNNVTVEIDSEAEKWGTVIVTKSGESLDNENIIAVKQAFADENGKAIFNFSMPETLEGGVNGKYDLHIKSGDEDVYIESMYYALPADRANVIDGLKNSTDIKAIIEDESNEEALRTLGIYLDIYNDLKDEDSQNENTALIDSVCETFVDYRTADMSDAEVIDLFNETLITKAVNTLDESVEVIEKMGFSFENIKYKNAEDAVKNFVCDYIYANKPYTSFDNVQGAYEVANMLYVINNTRFDTMDSKIQGYAHDLDITEDTIYIKYINSSNKTDINKDIVTALKKKNAVTVQELLTVIDTATKDNQGKGNPGGGGDRDIDSDTIDTPSNPLATLPVINNGNRVFNDIDDVSWAKTAILAMSEKGIIAGDGKGNFNPNTSVKREEFVKMLVVAADMHKADAKCAFDDVSDGAWYSSYVASAFNNNMVYGISEKAFGVGSDITRQDMAVMCYRAAKNANKLGKVRESVQFADESKMSEYAKEAVTALYEAGAINGIGDDLFDPAGTATRAQAAVIIYNLFVK